MKLKNKVAIITGAGKGIGRACAQLCLDEGAKVVLVSRTKKDLEIFAKENSKLAKNIFCITADVSKEASVKKAVKETIAKFKRIDILINNAGFGIFDNLIVSKTKDFDAMFGTNVRGLYFMTREVLPQMIKQNGGTIINIASIAGKQGFASGSIYCASKHAVMGMSKALMLEVRQHNIRVIAICPGSVDTKFFRPESKTYLSSRNETVLQMEDIAQSCLLAASLPMNAMISELEIRPTNPSK